MDLCIEVSPKHLWVALEDSHMKFSCRHIELCKLWLQPSWLKALNLSNITHTNSPDFIGTQYLAENDTEYLFNVTGSVTSSPSQTPFLSSTIKTNSASGSSPLWLNQYLLHISFMQKLHFLFSVKKIYHNFLNKSFFRVYRNNISPQDWRESQKVLWLLADGRICLTSSKLMSSCVSICYLMTTVYKMLKLTSRPPSENWEAHDITGKTKYKRKEAKTAGFLCAWAWDSGIFASGHMESQHQCRDLSLGPPGTLI